MFKGPSKQPAHSAAHTSLVKGFAVDENLAGDGLVGMTSEAAGQNVEKRRFAGSR